MSKKPKPPWNAVRIDAGNGIVWLVSRQAIEDDYATFLMGADKITLGHATEKVRSVDVEFWFNEQFDWSDVQRLGVQITRPTYEMLLAGVDQPTDLASTRHRFIAI
jgi:hypothetical protein